MCDRGADITIINETLLNKIQASNQRNEITPNNGKTIQSFSGEMKFLQVKNTKSQIVSWVWISVASSLKQEVCLGYPLLIQKKSQLVSLNLFKLVN